MPRCRWCGRSFTRSPGRGRPRQFCTQACRQKDYISRLRAQEAGLSEAELVVTRQALDDLRDRLYVLEAAVEDVESDLEAAATEQELRDALNWILAAARPLSGGADLT
jgi:hypothetical protein